MQIEQAIAAALVWLFAALPVAAPAGMMFGKSRKFDFTAKPGNYEIGATKVTTLANECLIAQLIAMR